jgi:hypothetical protein
MPFVTLDDVDDFVGENSGASGDSDPPTRLAIHTSGLDPLRRFAGARGWRRTADRAPPTAISSKEASVSQY